MVAVAGGKYTTYRIMARDAIDVVARNLDRTVPDSETHVTPLLGASGFQALWNRRRYVAQTSGVHEAWVEHLLRRYGTRIDDLLALIAERPELGEPLQGAEAYLAAEVTYACSHEGALHLDDVLARRTRISIETWDRGVEVSTPAARLMAEVLGWDEETTAAEIEIYRARVEAERRSQEQPDDRAADLERTAAPDVLARS